MFHCAFFSRCKLNAAHYQWNLTAVDSSRRDMQNILAGSVSVEAVISADDVVLTLNFFRREGTWCQWVLNFVT